MRNLSIFFIYIFFSTKKIQQKKENEKLLNEMKKINNQNILQMKNLILILKRSYQNECSNVIHLQLKINRHP